MTITAGPFANNSDEDKNSSSSSNMVQSFVELSAISASCKAVSIFGIVGNLLALAVICTHKPLRQHLSNYYFINQTIVDLIVSCLLIPSQVHNSGYASYSFCMLWHFKPIFLALYTTSVYSIVILAVERYLEVVHPIKHRLKVTKTKIIGSIVALWAFGIVDKFSLVMIPARSTNGVCSLVYANNAAMLATGLVGSFIDYFFPIGVVSVCYALTAHALHKKLKKVQPSNATGMIPSVAVVGGIGSIESVTPGPPRVSANISSRGQASAAMSRAKKNILGTMVAVVVCFVVCYTPKQTLTLMFYLGVTLPASYQLIANIGQILAFMNATVNPYIYLAYHREFRTGFRNLFKILLCCCMKSQNTVGPQLPLANSRNLAVDKVASVNVPGDDHFSFAEWPNSRYPLPMKLETWNSSDSKQGGSRNPSE